MSASSGVIAVVVTSEVGIDGVHVLVDTARTPTVVASVQSEVTITRLTPAGTP